MAIPSSAQYVMELEEQLKVLRATVGSYHDKLQTQDQKLLDLQREHYLLHHILEKLDLDPNTSQADIDALDFCDGYPKVVSVQPEACKRGTQDCHFCPELRCCDNMYEHAYAFSKIVDPEEQVAALLVLIHSLREKLTKQSVLPEDVVEEVKTIAADLSNMAGELLRLTRELS